MNPTEASGSIVYRSYVAITDVEHPHRFTEYHSLLAKDLTDAREVARTLLSKHEDCTVVIFEINPILRIYGKKELILSEQEIQPKETWRTD